MNVKGLPLVLGGLIAAFVLGACFGQQPKVPQYPTMGTPTSASKVESTFHNRLDEILREVQRANKSIESQGEQLDRIEQNTSQPETVDPPIVLPEPEQSDETSAVVDKCRQIVRLYTADSTWSCAACEVQKKRLASNPPSFEYEIIYGPSKGKSPTGKYPAWEVIRSDGSQEVKGGVQSTESLESWVSNTPQVSVQFGRYSIAELRDWIRQNYTRNTWLAADVQPRSAVWRHLQDHNHQFTAKQVAGLSQWEALALHAAHHSGRITPFRGSAKAVRSRRVRVVERPRYAAYRRSI